MLKIAIQAKGRLNEDSMALLADAGIHVAHSKRKLVAEASGFPIQVLYLRDDDIPQAVAMGVADVGIVGLNEIAEKNEDVQVLRKLGFGACRISLAVPRSAEYTGLEWFNGKRVATSYPRILRKFFAEHHIKADIHEVAGSVEIAPVVDLADAIFDIVSSGSTLVQNNLNEVEQVFFSEAALVATKKLTDFQWAEVDKLVFRFESIVNSRGMKYVLMNIPQDKVEEAAALCPGMRSPTVIPLADEGWVSLHVVVRDSELWEKVERLKKLGAEGILVLSLENMIK